MKTTPVEQNLTGLQRPARTWPMHRASANVVISKLAALRQLVPVGSMRY